MKVVWSALALERVVEIGEYIARDRPNAAADWVEGIFAAVRPLARFPGSGRPVPEFKRTDLREIIYESHRVIYRTDSDQVLIVTVRHTRQMLRSDDPDLR
ncbi:MAG: type II toxin-antitoxin system RelE/ParE family toxin [Longimicrobiaceae bacterium]